MGNKDLRPAAFVISVSLVLLADAVDLVIVGGGTSFEEKSKLTMKCTVPSFILGSTSLIWEIDTVTYADCAFTCTSYPPFPGNYNFTFDTVNGEFFLEIDPVQLSDSGRIFKCGAGTSSPPLSFTVTQASGDGGTTGDGLPPGAIVGIALGCVIVLTVIIIIIIIIGIKYLYKPEIIKIEPTDSTLTITCSGKFIHQKIYPCYKKATTTAGWKTERPISHPEKKMTHCVSNLKPSTSYEVKLYSKCGVLKSKKATCTIKTMATIEPPLHIRPIAENATHSSITLLWENGFSRSPVEFYTLKYKTVKAETWKTQRVDKCKDATVRFTLTDLEPKSEYRVKLCSVNEDGQSADTEEVSLQT